MSQTPYNMGNPMVGGPNGYQPYAQTQPKKSNTGCVVGVIIGVIVLLCLTCCGMAITFTMFALNAISSEVQYAIEDTPEIRQHIGEIESFSPNLVRTGSEDGDDVFVYDIQGSNGKGYVRIEHFTNENGDEELVWAELVTSDGQKIPLTLDDEADWRQDDGPELEFSRPIGPRKTTAPRLRQ